MHDYADTKPVSIIFECYYITYTTYEQISNVNVMIQRQFIQKRRFLQRDIIMCTLSILHFFTYID